MPSGLTEKIGSGMTFEQFILGCSRQFGALITLRDEPNGIEIPDVIEPSTYYKNALKSARAALRTFNGLTLKEQRNLWNKEYNTELEYRTKAVKEAKELKRKYQKMLRAVKKWSPPTEEHVGLLKFMIQQITSSIDWDCGYALTKYTEELKWPTFKNWREAKLKKLQDDIEYDKRQNLEEIQRCAERTAWIQALKQSLNSPPRIRVREKAVA